MLSVLARAALVFILWHDEAFNYPPLPKGMPPIHLMSQFVAGTEVWRIADADRTSHRPVAFILSGEMAVAYFQVHYPRSFWPSENLGAHPILFCFIFLYLVFAGGGAWSVDAMIARAKVGRT
jgi:putative oxidoreductase